MRRAVPRRAFLAAAGRSVLGASLASGASGSPSQRSEAPAPSEGLGGLIAELEEQLPGWMAEAKLPGLGIALIREARLAWQRSFGVADADTGAPLDDGTVFEAASMSKPVFAYAVLKLHETGVLDLDTPLTRYTTARFIDGDPRLDLVTARRVLSHTSGLPNWRSAAEPLALQFTPGERWQYSGEGYYYLQSVVTRLTGRVSPDACSTYEADVAVCATDIGDYLAARVLAPLGMSSSGYVWSDGLAAHAARPHDAEGAPKTKRHPTATDAARYAAAGGLHCTVADYAKFLIAVTAPGPADACRLEQDTVAEMVRPVIPVSEEPLRSSWALGWQVLHTDAGDIVAHGGDNAGFHSYAAACQRRRSGFVIMTNGDGGTRMWPKLLTPEMLMRLAAQA
jgi:CubicO group peptidase (beta-lactamase class C family)